MAFQYSPTSQSYRPLPQISVGDLLRDLTDLYNEGEIDSQVEGRVIQLLQEALDVIIPPSPPMTPISLEGIIVPVPPGTVFPGYSTVGFPGSGIGPTAPTSF